MTVYFVVKLLHILGACVLLGTGAGIAFVMLMVHRTGDPALIASTAGTVVMADLLFITSAGIVQPFTGGMLMQMSGATSGEFWIVASLLLYALAGLTWIPVMFAQIEMRQLAHQATADHAALPPRYHTLIRRWSWLCCIGFAAVLATLWLMIAKPSF